jgi:hypothetical protein
VLGDLDTALSRLLAIDLLRLGVVLSTFDVIDVSLLSVTLLNEVNFGEDSNV